MTTFLRLLADQDKAQKLADACAAVRSDTRNAQVFDVRPESFRAVPGSPFSYWVSEQVRGFFKRNSPFEGRGRTASVGASTKDNFRYTRSWYEVDGNHIGCSRLETGSKKWIPFAMGGRVSSYYRDINLVLNWLNDGAELKAAISEYRGSRGWGYQWSAALNGHDFYFRPGLTWPLRAGRFAPQVMPSGCIFSGRGYAAFVPNDELLNTLSIFNSAAFDFLFKVALGRFGHPEFLVGILQNVPFFQQPPDVARTLAQLARRAWSLKYVLDTTEEASHAFLLPVVLRTRLGDYSSSDIELQLNQIQSEIDGIVFDLYRLSESDRAAALGSSGTDLEDVSDDVESPDDAEDEDAALPTNETDGLLSWAVGVAFGRFDWRLATGERAAPPEPEPFDPLPAKSPGMLPDGAAPFHTEAGILVDDPGHPLDLARLVEEVLARVENPVPSEVRRWLQREFFAFHLQRYSKSRRKAPIYWPLSTASSSYTVWLYYPSLTGQTLYTAVNDIIEPKLKQVGQDLAALRIGSRVRTRDDEKRLEVLQSLELELMELRDALLQIAPTYRPNHEDGVQVSASPLWPLFRHKPWQKVLKDTWAKLEKGDHDWTHLAMAYWPQRVREKCMTDRSLAIAHGLEVLYAEPGPGRPRGRSKAGAE